ncbi:MAG: D-alanyl-D-alanine carboxypeptidase/D-alanyl-D-alanine-endopeptidase, partial [Bergeyella zoohelcum]|nr:D-alanyl-D-alanine carboxypeptidase/D-alanyl-D-alanine-endopeptidase [Bergeyella zoohelcum]
GNSAHLSFYVTDEKGNLVYDYDGHKGLTTASTQKIFTAAMALETLGKDYQWTTTTAYSGEIFSETLNGNLFVTSNGDPSLGSWRYENFKPENFKNQFISAIKNKNIKEINGDLVIDDSYFDFQIIPNGWEWGDVGNYYGAGVWGVNWRENQFDIHLENAKIKEINPMLPNLKWVNETAVAGQSDKSVVYTVPHSDVALINGTLPMKNIKVSGAMPNPPLVLGYEIKSWLAENNIKLNGKITTTSLMKINNEELIKFSAKNQFFEYKSPTLDKIIYWFMRKSVNLYGETLVKTMAKEKKNNSSFATGMEQMKAFWKSKGINEYMINFADGSGLSPKNYVSAKAEVQALLWAKNQNWFPVFYESFPTLNGMKMKSGTMKYTKSFAGYHTSKTGKKYVYSIIINNYQSSDLSTPLFRILDILK